MPVTELAQQLVNAYNAKDAAAFAALFDQEAEFVNVMGDRQRGRHQIHQAHEHAFATVLAGTSLSLEGLDVTALSDDVELGVMQWRRERAADAPTVGAPAGTGVFSLVARRTAEATGADRPRSYGWRLVAASNVPVMPVPGPPGVAGATGAPGAAGAFAPRP